MSTYLRLITCPRLATLPTSSVLSHLQRSHIFTTSQVVGRCRIIGSWQLVYVSQVDYISRIIYVAHIFSVPSSSVPPVCQYVRRGSLIKRLLIWILPPATLNFVAGGCPCLGRVFSPPEGEYALVRHSCPRRASSNLEGHFVAGGQFRQNPPALSAKHATIPPSRDKFTLPTIRISTIYKGKNPVIFVVEGIYDSGGRFCRRRAIPPDATSIFPKSRDRSALLGQDHPPETKTPSPRKNTLTKPEHPPAASQIMPN